MGGRGKRQDWPRDESLQASGYQVRRDGADQRDQDTDRAEELEVLVYLVEVRLQVQGAHAPAVLYDRLYADEEAVREAIAVLAWRAHGRAARHAVRIGRNQAPIAHVQPRGAHVWLYFERGQHLARIFRVVEGERRSTVLRDGCPEDLDVAHQQLPKGDIFVGYECGGGDQHHRSTGE